MARADRRQVDADGSEINPAKSCGLPEIAQELEDVVIDVVARRAIDLDPAAHRQIVERLSQGGLVEERHLLLKFKAFQHAAVRADHGKAREAQLVEEDEDEPDRQADCDTDE